MSGIALTFDDGPDEVWTPRLLDLLDNFDVRATFFPIAGRAAAQPQLIERMLAAGHTVGLHCHEHVRHSQRDESWLRADTATALELLAGVCVRPALWRTPWGDTAPWTAAVAAEYGLALVGWSVDTHDWRGDCAEHMLAATAPALVDGAVVLAHDGIGPGARRTDAAETLAWVELAVTRAREQGLALESLELAAPA